MDQKSCNRSVGEIVLVGNINQVWCVWSSRKERAERGGVSQSVSQCQSIVAKGGMRRRERGELSQNER